MVAGPAVTGAIAELYSLSQAFVVAAFVGLVAVALMIWKLPDRAAIRKYTCRKADLTQKIVAFQYFYYLSSLFKEERPDLGYCRFQAHGSIHEWEE